ncbi:MAG: hypothetical protein V7641_5476 [Blastocatellia bacterium]
MTAHSSGIKVLIENAGQGAKIETTAQVFTAILSSPHHHCFLVWICYNPTVFYKENYGL